MPGRGGGIVLDQLVRSRSFVRFGIPQEDVVERQHESSTRHGTEIDEHGDEAHELALQFVASGQLVLLRRHLDRTILILFVRHVTGFDVSPLRFLVVFFFIFFFCLFVCFFLNFEDPAAEKGLSLPMDATAATQGCEIRRHGIDDRICHVNDDVERTTRADRPLLVYLLRRHAVTLHPH